MLRISRAFVLKRAEEYDRHYEGTKDSRTEEALKTWLRSLPEPKYLDKTRFVRLARWKTPRQVHAYRRNSPTLVREATSLAYLMQNARLKIHILTVLEGVSVTVAATILHFLHPNEFPIFDFHARTTLRKAGRWSGNIDDSSVEAWEQYVRIMRSLSTKTGTSLRELDKALFAYDKWPSG